MRDLSRAGAFAALTLIAAIAGTIAPATAQPAGTVMTTPSGPQIKDTKVGTGASPKTGQICVMHYAGWLYEDGAKGKKFDSSVDRGQPFEFAIGMHRVIAGWDEGVATMKVGQEDADHPARSRLWRAWRRRRHSPECHAHFRRRAARDQRLDCEA